MNDAAITVRGLHKSYGNVQAVRGVDLEVERGEVFALLGPNGAGKTTIVEILEGYRERSSGEVSVLGIDPSGGPRALKKQIGIVLQSTGVEQFLTVAEAIDLYRHYYANPRPVDEVIELVGLEDKRNVRVNKLSGGQQRRLDVAIGLAGDPELLFLDEPTTGFDPSARRNAWQIVKNLAALDKTVFLTTHYMDEAQELAGRVAIIVDGKIVAEGPPATLGGTDSSTTTVTFTLPLEAPKLPKRLGGPAGGGDAVKVVTTNAMKTLHELTTWALDRNVSVQDLTVARPRLEDIYLELTTKSDESAGATGGAR